MAAAPQSAGATIPAWVRPTPDEMEAFEERAAVVEYQSLAGTGMTRKAAEKVALERMLAARRTRG